MDPGVCVKFTEMFEKATEKKSAQYYRTVVYNDTIENSALIIAAGKQKLYRWIRRGCSSSICLSLRMHKYYLEAACNMQAAAFCCKEKTKIISDK